MFGGSFEAHPVFKNIISIGFEFETHDLAKFSLHQNGTSLINTSTSLRLLDDGLQNGDIREVDNYLLLNYKKKLAKGEPNGEVAVLLDTLAKKSFHVRSKNKILEFFHENRDTDKNIAFSDTNDNFDSYFSNMLKILCVNSNFSKDQMYYFKTLDKVYDLKFLSESVGCQSFSGVEFVVTYFKPVSSPNIIVEMFVDACSRIIDHFGDLTFSKGDLLLKVKNDKTEIVGNVNYRRLYHKPGTNVFYLDTYDDYSWYARKGTPQPLSSAGFVPQMTFKCKALHGMEILKEITMMQNHNYSKALIKDMEYTFKEIEKIEKLVDSMIEAFNLTSSKKIHGDWGKIIKFYLFLIIYKIYKFVENHNDILLSNEDYLKDFLDFNSRHGNYDLYSRIREIMMQKLGVLPFNSIDFYYQPTILKEIYEDVEIDPSKFPANAVDAVLTKKDEHYGDPMYSLRSYFECFLKPTMAGEYDWFAKFDRYSTSFPLKDDEVLIENRSFRYIVGVWLKHNVSNKIHSQLINVKEMQLAVEALYKPKDFLLTLEENPTTHKLVRKCEPGKTRNRFFKCVKTGTRRR